MFHRFHTGTWQRRPSGRVPTRFIPVRVARATVTMAVLRIYALLLLFDCQEAFHCCLVVACINRINMISIECHRSGERCPGKREFDNRIEINRVRSGEIMWLFPLIYLIPTKIYIYYWNCSILQRYFFCWVWIAIQGATGYSALRLPSVYCTAFCIPHSAFRIPPSAASG